MYFQRLSYNKIGLGYFITDNLTKKYEARKEPNPKPLQEKEDLNKIESK